MDPSVSGEPARAGVRAFLGRLHPTALVLLGYVWYVAAGCLLLLLPFSQKGNGAGALDCFFTAASAVSTTGLTTVSVGDNHTFFGQLVILALIDDATCAALAAEAAEAGLDILWEVHDRAELERALSFSPRLVGINNRDLKTFTVTLDTTRALVRELPEDVLAVSESGLFTSDDLRSLATGGVRAFLIGESLIRAPDPGVALRELIDGGETKLGNLVTLCRFHHRLVHEGQVEIQTLDDGAFRFVKPDGQTFDSPLPAGDWATLLAAHDTADIRITPTTAVTPWTGGALDLELAVDALMQKRWKSVSAETPR